MTFRALAQRSAVPCRCSTHLVRPAHIATPSIDSCPKCARHSHRSCDCFKLAKRSALSPIPPVLLRQPPLLSVHVGAPVHWNRSCMRLPSSSAPSIGRRPVSVAATTAIAHAQVPPDTKSILHQTRAELATQDFLLPISCKSGFRCVARLAHLPHLTQSPAITPPFLTDRARCQLFHPHPFSYPRLCANPLFIGDVTMPCD